MIELNHIFLFLALLSPVAVLLLTWKREMVHSWRVASFVVLAITGISFLLFRHEAGYIGAGAWFALLFLPSMGLKRVAKLSAWHRYAEARRLTSLVRFVLPGRELRQQEALFRDLQARQSAGQLPGPARESYQWRGSYPLAGCWAVTTLIIVNVICFAIEGRSSTDPEVLSKLGALDTGLVILNHQYWRLGAALFLHYGLTHLLFNLFALALLGPALERAIGGVRFLLVYLISGLGSTVGVVILTALYGHPTQTVGASGCVMGVVGALASYLLRDWHRPESRERLQIILMIIGFEVIFDLCTPQVSMRAHMCGLVTGFALGIFL